MTMEGSPLPGEPVPPPKRPQGRRNLLIGCLGAVGLSCAAIGGFAFFDLQRNEQAYNAGHALYEQGDCEGAISAFSGISNIDNTDTDNETTLKAQAERSECTDYLAGAETQAAGDGGAALLNYRTFIDKYPDSPILPKLREQVTALYAATASVDLATADTCPVLDELDDRELIVEPDARLPELLVACGAVFEEAEDFTSAVNSYQRVRDEYPDDPLFEEATAGLARAAVAEARAAGAGEIPAPQSVGSSGGDTAVIVIQNDTPEKLSLIFSGPDVRVETLEPCTECDNFTVEPTGCPELGPIGSYTVAPGNYNVVVRSTSDTGVTPFQGNWDIGGGEEYYSCFFLVTSP
jgi:Tetratricopeptide repeat